MSFVMGSGSMKELISYDDFAKLDMCVGTIVAAECVPETDKLIRCSVDVGEGEPRTIVSGIAMWFPEADELVGKQCVYVVNLEPRTIRGIESQGMLMALSTPDGGFALLHPSVSVPAGTRIS